MTTTKKLAATPTSSKGELGADLDLGSLGDSRSEFFGAALNMSWQLAIVVLVPILGGFKLDEHFKSLPLWTIVGFILAMIGMAAVIWRQLQLFSPTATQPTPKGRRS